MSTADRTSLVAPQPISHFHRAGTPKNVIRVDDSISYQSIDGFGHAVTGGTAQLMIKMSHDARHALLEDLFGHGPGQRNMSYIRVSIGASDMNESVYTYDDLPDGSTDPTLSHFSLAPDETYVIPVVKEIIAIHPGIRILASPWTPPSWMKDNGKPKGGTLLQEDYEVYASYLVKYLQEMKLLGIPITTLTVQNEPENPKNTPSMVLTAEQEARFIGKYLGPAMVRANLHTEIVAFDHNCDHPQYPITVLSDSDAGKFTGGSGFHLYLGNITALSVVHNAFPNKDIFFTEQLVIPHRNATNFGIAEPAARVMIGATTNWARNVLLWNLAADPENGPHTNDGGCPVCSGAITLDGDKVTRNLAYYVTAHFTQFVPPGSVRVRSDSEGLDLPQVAFRTPHGRHVLVVSNTGAVDEQFWIGYKQKFSEVKLPAGGVATYAW
ncbi:MAG TPA: glycoside hydrolase family 30 beta sandwich domain-containing protein [Acidobacteriaceae bacterium]|nr:glycoside hydrolase family 30 beta sandwich domain-containing protein [Acidobacteriaceae bacterium]